MIFDWIFRNLRFAKGKGGEEVAASNENNNLAKTLETMRDVQLHSSRISSFSHRRKVPIMPSQHKAYIG